MFYVLYIDPQSGQFAYEDHNEPYTDDTEYNWRNDNPDKNLIAIFDNKDNKINLAHEERNNFALLCRDYGFSMSDYRMKILANGQLCELIGFKPRNRKYPCILRPCGARATRNIKASPLYVKNHIA